MTSYSCTIDGVVVSDEEYREYVDEYSFKLIAEKANRIDRSVLADHILYSY